MKLWGGWSASQRGVLIGLLGLLFVYLTIRLIANSQYVSDPQPQMPPRASELEDRIDPNTADWSTLAAMPLIGEKRAHDIVAYREQFAATHPGEPAYRTLQDLHQIKGIGTATLSQIEPYLIFGHVHSPASAP